MPTKGRKIFIYDPEEITRVGHGVVYHLDKIFFFYNLNDFYKRKPRYL